MVIRFALQNAFSIASENRQLLLDHSDVPELSTVGRFVKADDGEGRVLQAAIADRQQAAPLYEALDKLFQSLMHPTAEGSELTVKDWALRNNTALNKVTLALWPNRDKLDKAAKKAAEKVKLRDAAHKRKLKRPRPVEEPIDDDQEDNQEDDNEGEEKESQVEEASSSE
jgi:hypothetical protein